MDAEARLKRADARLKMVKACDAVAAAMEALHVAVQKADPKDVASLHPGNPFTKPGDGSSHLAPSIHLATREVMIWAAHLHDEGRFERLGTKRWPDAHRPMA